MMSDIQISRNTKHIDLLILTFFLSVCNIFKYNKIKFQKV